MVSAVNERTYRSKPSSPGGLDLGPLEMIVLQGTSRCNFNCSYCYLSESSRRAGRTMEPDEVALVARRIFESPYTGNRLRFSWHSGEPLILGVEYYRRAIQIILDQRDKILGDDFIVDFDIQTNASLIDQELCDLILDLEGALLLGVSCDGPAHMHDRHRVNWSNRPTHDKTEAGMKLLAKNGIPFDVTAVLSFESLAEPEAFLDYFSQFSENIREFHYNLLDEFFIADPNSEEVRSYITQYQSFLLDLIRHITESVPGTFPALRNLSGFYNRLLISPDDRPAYDARSMSKPFKTLSIEANGDATTFYAGLTLDECKDLADIYGDAKGFVVGNIYDEDLAAIGAKDKLRRIHDDFETSHAACENHCDYFEVCSGGYNLIKFRRFKTFDTTTTPECEVHVQTFADTMLSHMSREIEAAE